MNPLIDVPTSPEVRLVLACLRSRYDPQADPGAIVEALRTPIDADHLLEVCRRHAVTPLVHSALEPHRARVPSHLAASLKTRAAEIRLDNLDVTGELVRLVDALNAVGIDVLPYKGPMAAEGLYGDLGLREFVDLDLLVRPADVARALRQLEARGYEALVPVTPQQLSFLLRSGHDRKMVRADRYVTEIQWRIAGLAEGPPIGAAPLLHRATTLKIGGRELPTLSSQDEALILSVHGALHLWGRLSWICDTAEMLRLLDDRVAAGVVRQAERAGTRRAFLSGPALAAKVIGAPLPSAIEKAVFSEAPALSSTLDELVVRLLGPAGPELPGARDHLRLRMALADTRRRQVGVAVRAVTTPTISDWHAVRLPSILWFLYYPIRLGRLFMSYIAKDRQPGDWVRQK